MTGLSASDPWPQSPPGVGEVRVAREEEFAERAAETVATLLRGLAAGRTGTISVALAGGSTPRPVYESLSEKPEVPWSRLEFYFGDERAVPPDDADSNYRMARESLLDRVPISQSHVHRMHAEDRSAESAAGAYAAVLPRALDVLLLGLGSDGHTASLFPGSRALHAGGLVASSTGPTPPYSRLTVTPLVLARARRIVVLACGNEKAPAVARALTASWDPEDCPAQLARGGLWLLDVAAAAGLPDHLCARADRPVESSR